MTENVPKTILCVEDHRIVLRMIKATLLMSSYDVKYAETLAEASALLDKHSFDCVLLDKYLQGKSSFQLITKIKKSNPRTGIVIYTSDEDLESVSEAINLGADDYLVKTDNYKDLPVRLTLAYRKANQSYISNKLSKNNYLEAIENTFVGSSQYISNLRHEVLKLQGSNCNVHIFGESGTGKEIIAKAIHSIEGDATRPYFTINCGAISDNLFESELFGHVKGSFTGAYQDKKGLFELSNGGDLFLDEIGDLSLENQVKLLRALESGEYRPIGSNVIKKAKVRIITATNKNLEKLIEKKKFREDLFYRINVVTFETQPLKSRPEDIDPLARHFIKQLTNSRVEITKSAMKAIATSQYKGNIRELRNAIEKAFINARSANRNYIDLADLVFLKRSVDTLLEKELSNEAKMSDLITYHDYLEQKSEQYLQRVLEKAGHNPTKACEIAGLSKSQFYKLIKKHVKENPKTLRKQKGDSENAYLQ